MRTNHLLEVRTVPDSKIMFLNGHFLFQGEKINILTEGIDSYALFDEGVIDLDRFSMNLRFRDGKVHEIQCTTKVQILESRIKWTSLLGGVIALPDFIESLRVSLGVLLNEETEIMSFDHIWENCFPSQIFTVQKILIYWDGKAQFSY